MLRRILVLSIACCASVCAAINEYALILNTPPLSQRAITRGAIQSTADSQTTLRSELAQRKIRTTGSVRVLLNAVFVRATPDRVPELSALPGVQSVQLLPPVHRHLNRALDLVKVPQAWTQISGGMNNAGAGIKIGILDTGIDQNHPAFQDQSLSVPSGYPLGQTAFTNKKVIVARSYVSKLPFDTVLPADSRPDDISPRDRVGHGTNMAMIAAGATNTGPVAAITGVAPKAFLGNYKIFGSPGINDQTTNSSVVIQALEDAVTDRMDVVTLPVGYTALFGALDQATSCASTPPSQIRPYIPANACDVLSQAVEHAIQTGLTVVVSAGNDGASGLQFPTLGTINSPGTAPSAITVGASTNSHILYASVRVNGSGVPSNIQQVDAIFGAGPKPAAPVTAPVVDVTRTGDDGTACNPISAGALKGSIALIQRGVCAFDVKVNHAQLAGAVAVLLYETDPTAGLFVPTNLTDTAIPLAFIQNAPALSIQSFLRSNANATATLDPALHAEDASFDTVADFSSRGPVIGTLGIKPELVAVGTDLYTATQSYDPNGDTYDAKGYTTVQGTSFAAAMVAGAVALVKQTHPGFTPAQLKSAVVNTATGEIRDDNGVAARVTSVGAGKLNVAGAVSVNATVVPSTVSFGAVSSGSLPMNQALNLTNTGTASATFTISVAPRDSDSNAAVTVSPTSVTLTAGQSRAVTVQLTGKQPNPGTYEGQINITGGAISLHVPYLYLVGDGVAYNLFSVLGDGLTGVLNETNDVVAFRLVDQFGVAVKNAPVTFKAVSGGGQIDSTRGADASTDVYGIAGAFVILGSQPGDQVFEADVAGLSWQFFLTAQPQPAITTVVNAASIQTGQGLAPGSYVAIMGSNLSPTTSQYPTVYLPPSIAGVSVSFDVPSANISVPGHLWYVSAGQINVQIPWELQGQSSALMKVSLNGIPSATFTVPLSDYAPGFFEFNDPSTGQMLAIGQDVSSNFQLITTKHPAPRGGTIVLYANGVGPVTNQPPSGEITPPTQPFAENRVKPVVKIGGRDAQVTFSGLAPYFVGLYQINVVVPPDAPTGVQPLTMMANGVTAKTSNLPIN